MLKWLLFLLIVYLLYRLWHHAPAPRAKDAKGENMMRCELCGLHVPEREAVREGSHVFCGEQHRASWKQGR